MVYTPRRLSPPFLVAGDILVELALTRLLAPFLLFLPTSFLAASLLEAVATPASVGPVGFSLLAFAAFALGLRHLHGDAPAVHLEAVHAIHHAPCLAFLHLEEGEVLLAKARKEADEIVSKAKSEAEEIVSSARKSASELKSKAESDIKMASAQSLQATRQDIENLLVKSVVDAKADKALKDPDFIKEIIRSVAGKFSASEGVEISLLLPASMKKDLEDWVKGELSKTLSKGVKAEFSKKIAGGFSIGPKDGSWFIDLSDDTFKSLIAEYLRPVTRKLLFG